MPSTDARPPRQPPPACCGQKRSLGCTCARVRGEVRERRARASLPACTSGSGPVLESTTAERPGSW
eukprot:8129554-Alexandrium_andersonii.AAC.1